MRQLHCFALWRYSFSFRLGTSLLTNPFATQVRIQRGFSTLSLVGVRPLTILPQFMINIPGLRECTSQYMRYIFDTLMSVLSISTCYTKECMYSHFVINIHTPLSQHCTGVIHSIKGPLSLSSRGLQMLWLAFPLILHSSTYLKGHAEA